VGMTEMEARLQYGKDLFTLHTPPQQASQTTDLEFCKLLCRRNGRIIGAHAVGNNALELIETVAIAMNAKLNVYQLGRLADASFGTITQLATQLDQQIYSRNLGKQAWLEKWFNWRRQWNI
jgi:pyruvate/2-oxoglutarate dehydrogenase complex dihydrolipoamide dehydrogenase (E3) component